MNIFLRYPSTSKTYTAIILPNKLKSSELILLQLTWLNKRSLLLRPQSLMSWNFRKFLQSSRKLSLCVFGRSRRAKRTDGSGLQLAHQKTCQNCPSPLQSQLQTLRMWTPTIRIPLRRDLLSTAMMRYSSNWLKMKISIRPTRKYSTMIRACSKLRLVALVAFSIYPYLASFSWADSETAESKSRKRSTYVLHY